MAEGITGPFLLRQPLSVKYFRFYLGESDLCREVQITARSEYGTVNLLVSNINPFPSFADNEAQWKINTEQYGFAQSSVTLCPNAGSAMQPGTYAIAVEAVNPSLFFLEIELSKEGSRPLESPPTRVSCDDVVMTDLGYSEESFAGQNQCLEDGVTSLISITSDMVDEYVQLVLPVPAGCPIVSLSAMSTSGRSQPDLYCLPVDYSRYPTSENSLVSRHRDGSDSLLFAGCYEEEVTYVSCSLKSEGTGTVAVIWSTEAEPVRTRIEETSPGAMTMTQGLTAIQAVALGANATNAACDDYYFDCFSWLTYPLTDAIPWWPLPASNAKLDYTWVELPVPTAIENELVSVVANKLTMVVILSTGRNTHFYGNSDYLERGNIVSLSVTGETGLPLQFNSAQNPTTAGLPNGAIPTFLPTLPASEANFVEFTSVFCDGDKFQQIVALINTRVDELVTNGVVLTDVNPRQLNIVSYRGMRAIVGCSTATADMMTADVIVVCCISFLEISDRI